MVKKVIVGLSGGVDSAVSAYLLKKEGYHVTGVFMKNWEEDDDSEYCHSREDWLDAAAVADKLDIEIEAANFSKEYRERVFTHFIKEYQEGRTPNPDVFCNSEIKFSAFLDYSTSLGADAIATGHYAGVENTFNRGDHFLTTQQATLLRAADSTKDQSYFLYRLSQPQLEKAIFPLAHRHKTEVRKLAQEIGLSNAKKKDSVGICFIGKRPFREFLQRYVSHKKGAIVNDNGRVIGEHHGLAFYTLGQRKGLGIGGIKALKNNATSLGAWYVAAKDFENNQIIAVQDYYHPLLQRQEVLLENCNWIAGALPQGQLSAKSRYRQKDSAIERISMTDSGVLIRFKEPQWALTPGQSCVLYQGSRCLGGGIISRTL